MSRLAAALTVVAVVLAGCGTGGGTTTTVHSLQEEQQAYGIVDGRAGYRRLPLVDVSSVRLTDYADDPAGAPFTPVAAPGELVLLFFGYLSCPDVCPTTVADYGAALEMMPPDLAERVSFGMVSVDPERDTGVEIADYVSVFVERAHALLAADPAGLQAATDAFGAFWEIEDHEEGHADYGVGHTATVYATDEEGRIVWEFTHPTPPADLAAALTDLLDERY